MFTPPAAKVANLAKKTFMKSSVVQTAVFEEELTVLGFQGEKILQQREVGGIIIVVVFFWLSGPHLAPSTSFVLASIAWKSQSENWPGLRPGRPLPRPSCTANCRKKRLGLLIARFTIMNLCMAATLRYTRAT